MSYLFSVYSFRNPRPSLTETGQGASVRTDPHILVAVGIAKKHPAVSIFKIPADFINSSAAKHPAVFHHSGLICKRQNLFKSVFCNYNCCSKLCINLFNAAKKSEAAIGQAGLSAHPISKHLAA